jgi:hypothetical protein
MEAYSSFVTSAGAVRRRITVKDSQIAIKGDCI